MPRGEFTGISDTPSFKHHDRLARGLEQLLIVNSVLLRLGLGSKKLGEVKRELKELRAGMHEIASYLERFNRCFSKEGWLAFGSFDFEVLKQAVDDCEAGRTDEATARLLQYFGPASVSDQLSRLGGVEELRIRRRLVDLAFIDYQAGRYHAVIPVLLMLIDGAVDDALGAGFHSDALDLDAWDSLTAADGAIYDIRAIFKRGRRTTRTEPISLPYRNGILHGMDLGYDNEVVAAKCWCFLFVVADWIKDKKSEVARQEHFAEETRIPSFRELAERISATERMKQALETWSPRTFRPGEVARIGSVRLVESGTPEEAVLRFLALWAAGNFGGMAKMYWSHACPESPRLAGDVRALLGDVKVGAYGLERIDDEGSGATQVAIVVNPESDCPRRYVARMIFESDSGEVLPRSLPGGAWRVVWVQASASSSDDAAEGI